MKTQSALFKGAITARNIFTGETKILEGHNQIVHAGFTPSSVYKCVNGKQTTHMNHTFTRN